MTQFSRLVMPSKLHLRRFASRQNSRPLSEVTLIARALRAPLARTSHRIRQSYQASVLAFRDAERDRSSELLTFPAGTHIALSQQRFGGGCRNGHYRRG